MALEGTFGIRSYLDNKPVTSSFSGIPRGFHFPIPGSQLLLKGSYISQFLLLFALFHRILAFVAKPAFDLGCIYFIKQKNTSFTSMAFRLQNSTAPSGPFPEILH